MITNQFSNHMPRGREPVEHMHSEPRPDSTREHRFNLQEILTETQDAIIRSRRFEPAVVRSCMEKVRLNLLRNFGDAKFMDGDVALNSSVIALLGREFARFYRSIEIGGVVARQNTLFSVYSEIGETMLRLLVDKFNKMEIDAALTFARGK